MFYPDKSPIQPVVPQFDGQELKKHIGGPSARSPVDLFACLFLGLLKSDHSAFSKLYYFSSQHLSNVIEYRQPTSWEGSFSKVI